MKYRHRIIAGLFTSMILASGIGQSSAADQPPGPPGLVGFSGQVRGVVVDKRDRGVVGFKVGRIIQTWKNNKAEKPEALKGRTVPVGPAWVISTGRSWGVIVLWSQKAEARSRQF